MENLLNPATLDIYEKALRLCCITNPSPLNLGCTKFPSLTIDEAIQLSKKTIFSPKDIYLAFRE